MKVALYVWHEWFAWYPVEDEEGQFTFFLQTIERRKVLDLGGRPRWEYRELPLEPDIEMGTGA